MACRFPFRLHPSRDGQNHVRNHWVRVADGRNRSDEELQALQLERLPASAEDFYADRLPPPGWNPTVRTLLLGTRAKENIQKESAPLALLRSFENTLIRKIYSYVPSFDHVRLTLPADLVGQVRGGHNMMVYVLGRRAKLFRYSNVVRQRGMEENLKPYASPRTGYVSFCKVNEVEFPPSNDRNTNMMPFILGEVESLPDDLKCYYPIIEACPYFQEEIGKVAFLTVHESDVKQAESQRRPGIHIESPGIFPDPNKSIPGCSFLPGAEHRWGSGVFFGPDQYEGGIYIASNTDDTTEVWNALVDGTAPGAVYRHGGCEHLRSLLGQGTKLKAGELTWLTDCTPHEALSQPVAGTRQFFRLVMPYVSHWYADHSTANPKVSLPDSITVIHGSKFKE